MISGLLALSGALFFTSIGIGLIAYSVHVTRMTLARRVDTIRVPDISAPDARPGTGRDAMLIRLKTQGQVQQEQREMIRWMTKLGIAQNRAIAAFGVARIISGGILAMAALLLALRYTGVGNSVPQMMAVVICAGGAGWLAPKLVLESRVRNRVRSISRGLPDALELLVVCVEAGLSLEDGIERVCSELWESHPALAQELALTSADLKILPSRDQALANLADRIDLPTIRSIVSTLSQTMRFGTPLAQAMRVVASEMRNDALVAMEERANRLPALMTVPMIVFILPTIFMILGGPAVLRVIDNLAQ